MVQCGRCDKRKDEIEGNNRMFFCDKKMFQGDGKWYCEKCWKEVEKFFHKDFISEEVEE
jgi:hypothetical protein